MQGNATGNFHALRLFLRTAARRRLCRGYPAEHQLRGKSRRTNMGCRELAIVRKNGFREDVQRAMGSGKPEPGCGCPGANAIRNEFPVRRALEQLLLRAQSAYPLLA